MKREYEVIRHSAIKGLEIFLVNIYYRTPHMHRDFELVFVLQGELKVSTEGASHSAPSGSFFLMNPYQLHEFRSEGGVLIMPVQVSPGLLGHYLPGIGSLHVPFAVFHRTDNAATTEVCENLLKLLEAYLLKEDWFELECIGFISQIFYRMFSLCPPAPVSGAQRKREEARKEKLRFLSSYIEDHYTENIRLSDLADALGVSQYYLSHFFRENYGMSFLDYVTSLRCDHAGRELLSTNRALLDICYDAGFSDPKYFQKAFRSKYGLSPREYRVRFRGEQTFEPRSAGSAAASFSPEGSSATLQFFPDEKESLAILRRIQHNGSV
ncbi:MAG: helix-turn-helix transcriptional regulator [Lachnospiraceae bacterium]|nr:helix-turn-helix transcriptional regulator [Lachnospiraceae bacterium]